MKFTEFKAAVCAVFLCAGVIRAEEGRFALAPESRLWLEGDSTLHPYKSTATLLSAAGETAAATPAAYLAPGAVKAFRLTVPVKGLKSGKGGLDNNMYKALKADQYADIVFRLADFTAAPAETGFNVTARGALTVAGQERPVTLEARAALADGRLHLTGKEDLRMTDFGIKPPSMMMGAVKTRDEITIHYDIFIEAQPQIAVEGDSHE